MKALSQLIHLFEKEPKFLKEWKDDPVSAVNKRCVCNGEQGSSVRKIVNDLCAKKHLSKRPTFFGM